MTPSESDLVGEPIEDVPKRGPGEYCNARKSSDGVFQGYCNSKAGAGTDHLGDGRCRWHGGTQPTGKDSPNYKHGAYSKHMRSDLTEPERAAYEELVDSLEDPEQTLDAIRELAAEALLKYKRSADERFLREFRQLADTFNLAPNEQRLEVEADVETEHSVPDHVAEAIAGAAESNLEGGDDE